MPWKVHNGAKEGLMGRFSQKKDNITLFCPFRGHSPSVIPTFRHAAGTPTERRIRALVTSARGTIARVWHTATARARQGRGRGEGGGERTRDVCVCRCMHKVVTKGLEHQPWKWLAKERRFKSPSGRQYKTVNYRKTEAGERICKLPWEDSPFMMQKLWISINSLEWTFMKTTATGTVTLSNRNTQQAKCLGIQP